jgi:RNA polymerase sigma-70 factor (ECF subfamily)
MASDVRAEMILLLPRLRRFGRALTGSQEKADDLVQGACERALRSIASFTPGSHLDSWMYRILRNLWIDDLRQRRFEVQSSDGIDIAGEDGRRTAEGRSDLSFVRSRIAELPPEQREVLVLVCIEDLSYRETAEMLEIPIGTVMSRLARARIALGAASARDAGPRSEAARGASR